MTVICRGDCPPPQSGDKMPSVMSPSGSERTVLTVLILAALAVSGIGPFDRLTWVLEIAPILIGLPLLYRSRDTFPLTPLLYRLLFLHALILMAGGHYSYARVPAGDWVRDFFHLARNPYDRLGHFAQGFIPAILAREILLRRTPLKPGGWLFFLTVCVCLAFSAFYELTEWLSAVILGQGADDFLGTQGDPWDTQWDMFMALVGSISAQLLLASVHQRQLAQLPATSTEVRSPAAPA